jgi:hypothetical protein
MYSIEVTPTSNSVDNGLFRILLTGDWKNACVKQPVKIAWLVPKEYQIVLSIVIGGGKMIIEK